MQSLARVFVALALWSSVAIAYDYEIRPTGPRDAKPEVLISHYCCSTGCQVGIRWYTIYSSGSHVHDRLNYRPPGVITTESGKKGGTIKPDPAVGELVTLTDNSGNDNVLMFRYQPPEVAGETRICHWEDQNGSIVNYQCDKVTVRVWGLKEATVVPPMYVDPAPIAGASFESYGSGNLVYHDPWDKFANADMKQRLAHASQMYAHCVNLKIAAGKLTQAHRVRVSAISLEWGGLSDIYVTKNGSQTEFRPPHSNHRYGEYVDISFKDRTVFPAQLLDREEKDCLRWSLLTGHLWFDYWVESPINTSPSLDHWHATPSQIPPAP